MREELELGQTGLNRSMGYVEKFPKASLEADLIGYARGIFGADYDAKSACTKSEQLKKKERRSPFFNRRGTEFIAVESGCVIVNGQAVRAGDLIRIDSGEIVEIHAEEDSQIVSHIFPYAQALTHLPFTTLDDKEVKNQGSWLITIVIIAKDVEHHIAHAISSCLTQTYNNIQVVVVDDGSTDGTLAKARSMADFDDRLEVHAQPIGRNSVRRFGVSIARGQYCLIIDGDDWLNMDAVERLVQTAAESNSDCVMFGFDHHSDRNRTVWDPVYPTHAQLIVPPLYYSKDEIAALQIAEHNHTIWMYFFSMDIRQNVMDSLIDVHLYEDLPFYIAILQYSNHPVICNFVLYHYRRDRIGQATSNWERVPAIVKKTCLELVVDHIIESLPDRDRWFYQLILYYKIRKIVDHEWSLEKHHGNAEAFAMWERMSDVLARKFPANLASRIITEHQQRKFVEAHSDAPIGL